MSHPTQDPIDYPIQSKKFLSIVQQQLLQLQRRFTDATCFVCELCEFADCTDCDVPDDGQLDDKYKLYYGVFNL